MKRVLIMAALTACGGFCAVGSVLASVTHYPFPANIALELRQSDTDHVEAVIEARTGSPAEVQLFFESSDNIRVAPASASIDRLTAVAPGKFRLLIGHTGKPTDASGSWVRLRAVYKPDYDSLASAVSDMTKYPDENERQRLLDIIARNKAAAAVQTDAARLDMKENPGRGQ
ncbi:MAG TPA: hypothetical protein PKM25_00790 [Candidatus Ozemobacteraceae bacterium]|nr:hypothetical protein [Candidatus Ozemobacteraceae bacterium]